MPASTFKLSNENKINKVNQNEINELTDMLFVIKRYFMENNRQSELADWYQYAIEDNMQYFRDRIVKKYTSLNNELKSIENGR